jgi:hypothetical protein
MRVSATLAVLEAAPVLSTGAAFAASSWTSVSAPPTEQNGNLLGVSAVPDSDAWAVGTENGAANTGIGAKAPIDNWNGTPWANSPSAAAVLPSGNRGGRAVTHTAIT